jgi:hypothetical protein
MSINLNGFWQSWGVVSGNTQATNQYDFWKGMVMSNGQVLNNSYDFFKYHNTTRYQWFKNLQGTYPEVWDEYTFYANTNDVGIYDMATFYQYGGAYLASLPSCYELLRYDNGFGDINDYDYAGYGWLNGVPGTIEITFNSGLAPDGNYYTIFTNDNLTGIGVVFDGTTWLDNAYNYFDVNNGWFGTFSATTVFGFTIPAEQTNVDGTLSYPNCP